MLDGSGHVQERELTGLGLSQIFASETGSSGSNAGTVSWMLTNQVGSVTDVLDNSAVITYHFLYDGFGNVESEINHGGSTRFGYAGMQTDRATGLDHDNARYYDPQSGRFVSQDPLSFGGGDYNLYRYVFNSLTTTTDPSGRYVPSLQDIKDLGSLGLDELKNSALSVGQTLVDHLGYAGIPDYDLGENIGILKEGADSVAGIADAAADKELHFLAYLVEDSVRRDTPYGARSSIFNEDSGVLMTLLQRGEFKLDRSLDLDPKLYAAGQKMGRLDFQALMLALSAIDPEAGAIPEFNPAALKGLEQLTLSVPRTFQLPTSSGPILGGDFSGEFLSSTEVIGGRGSWRLSIGTGRGVGLVTESEYSSALAL